MTTVSTITSTPPVYTPPASTSAPAPADNTPADDTSGTDNAIYNTVAAASAPTVRGVTVDILA
jgi:hypothetical protein